MSIPKKLWRVVVVPGGNSLGYAKRGGRTFSQESAARGHLAGLRRDGVICELYKCEPVWELVEAGRPEVEGEQQLW